MDTKHTHEKEIVAGRPLPYDKYLHILSCGHSFTVMNERMMDRTMVCTICSDGGNCSSDGQKISIE